MKVSYCRYHSVMGEGAASIDPESGDLPEIMHAASRVRLASVRIKVKSTLHIMVRGFFILEEESYDSIKTSETRERYA